MTPAPALDLDRAARLVQGSLVWDHHACMPLRPQDQSFLPQLARHRQAGFDAVTVNIGFGEMGPDEHLAMLAALRRWLSARPEAYVLGDSAQDVEAARAAGKLAVSFDIEGANGVGERLDLVEQYRAQGVRWMLLAYNRNNPFGGGCQDEDSGLTGLGRELVAEMERVGMLVCLSHTGHRTVRDVLAVASQPVIFSHSNCSAVHAHPRNIPDELIRACAATGGVVHMPRIGLARRIVAAEEDAHAIDADHAVQLVGPAHVSISLDYVFDMQELEDYTRKMQHTFPPGLGYELGPRFVPPEQITEIVATLQAWGYADADLQAILGGNLMRLSRHREAAAA
jgi:membrane dipeptidase